MLKDDAVKDSDVPSEQDADVIPQEKKTEATSVAHTNKISQSYNNLPRVHIKPNNLRYFQQNATSNMDKSDAFDHPLNLHMPQENTTNDDSCNETTVVNATKEELFNGIVSLAEGSNNGDSLPLSPEHQRCNSQTHSTFANFDESMAGNAMRRNTLWSNLNRDQSHSKYTENSRYSRLT